MSKINFKEIYESIENQQKYGLINEDAEEKDTTSKDSEKSDNEKSETKEKVTVDSLIKDMMKLEPSQLLKFIAKQENKDAKAWLLANLLPFAVYVVKNNYIKAKALGSAIKDVANKNKDDDTGIDYDNVEIDESTIKSKFAFDEETIKKLHDFIAQFKKEMEAGKDDIEKAAGELDKDIKKAGVKIEPEKLADNTLTVAGVIDDEKNKNKSGKEMTELVNQQIEIDKKIKDLLNKANELKKLSNKIKVDPKYAKMSVEELEKLTKDGEKKEEASKKKDANESIVTLAGAGLLTEGNKAQLGKDAFAAILKYKKDHGLADNLKSLDPNDSSAIRKLPAVAAWLKSGGSATAKTLRQNELSRIVMRSGDIQNVKGGDAMLRSARGVLGFPGNQPIDIDSAIDNISSGSKKMTELISRDAIETVIKNGQSGKNLTGGSVYAALRHTHPDIYDKIGDLPERQRKAIKFQLGIIAKAAKTGDEDSLEKALKGAGLGSYTDDVIGKAASAASNAKEAASSGAKLIGNGLVDGKGHAFSPSGMLQKVGRFDDYFDDGKLDPSEYKEMMKFQDSLIDYQTWAAENAGSDDPNVQAKIAQIALITKKFNGVMADNDKLIKNAEAGMDRISDLEDADAATKQGTAQLANNEETKKVASGFLGKLGKALRVFGQAKMIAKMGKFILNDGKAAIDAIGGQYLKFKEDQNAVAEMSFILMNKEDSSADKSDTKFSLRFDVSDLKWHITNLDDRKKKIEKEDVLIKKILDNKECKSWRSDIIKQWTDIIEPKDEASKFVPYFIKNYEKLGTQIKDKNMKKYFSTLQKLIDNFDKVKKEFA